MSNCPKCQQPELIWTKTEKGKNWLKDQNGNWHTCNQPTKPIEVSASDPIKREPSPEEKKLGKNYYHCPLCPEGAGWLYRLSKEEIEIHNGTLHPQGQDYSKLKISEVGL